MDLENVGNEGLTDSALETVEQSTVEDEKLLPQSRVTELIKKAKLKGRDEMNEELTALKQEIEALKNGGQQAQPTGLNVNLDEIASQVSTKIERQLAEQREAEKLANMQAQADKVANSYYSKMSAGKELFEDFDQVTQNFNAAAFPELIFLAESVGDTAGVMYELAKHPQKLATIDYLAHRDPQAARAMLLEIEKSIAVNKVAQQQADQAKTNDPLSRLKPSQAGTDSGDLSVDDYRRMSWLRT